MNKRTKIILSFSIFLMLFLMLFIDNSYSGIIVTEAKAPDYSLIANVPTINQDTNTSITALQNKYQNNDIVGILKIPNTNINEIVVQSNDNDFYLNHDLYKNYKKAGSTFLDYRVNINEGQKNLIYSHNSTKGDLPFSELEKYYDENFYQGHEFIELETDKDTSRYTIFSVFVEASDWSYMYLNFSSNKWYEHLKQLKDKSWYDTGVTINKDDEILILQTCSFHQNYQKYSNKYLLVIAKKV